ncbi:MAG: thiamine-phosphate pyrophosphorylase [Candidatus Omnitrophota bacterium]
MPIKKLSSETCEKSTRCDSYRIIDANINRCKEGLRVCEEIARFHLKNSCSSKKYSVIRHMLTKLCKESKLDQKELFKHRDSKRDVGRAFNLGPKRSNFQNIFLANAQRTKEAFRVLEEFSKLFDTTLSKNIQNLRFDFYELEKTTIKKFPALLDS